MNLYRYKLVTVYPKLVRIVVTYGANCHCVSSIEQTPSMYTSSLLVIV